MDHINYVGRFGFRSAGVSCYFVDGAGEVGVNCHDVPKNDVGRTLEEVFSVELFPGLMNGSYHHDNQHPVPEVNLNKPEEEGVDRSGDIKRKRFSKMKA